MKKILFLASLLLALSVSGQFKAGLPMSVQQFYLEQAAFENMKGLPYPSLLNGFLSAPRPSFSSPRLVDGVEMVDAFIDIQGSHVISSLKSAGVKVNCEFDGFVTAQIPMSQLERVHLIPGVTNVEISRMVELCSDSTMKSTHVDQMMDWRTNKIPMMYNGKNVVIGIIDYGFDFKHIAFKTANGTKNRIKRVYSTANTTGHPVVVDDNVIPGSVFMGAQLDTMTTDDYQGYHGTHTTCLAAGTHYGGYGGMAPEADIVLCAPESFKWGFRETEIVNCIKYIYSYADSVHKPCVISMSVSTSFGPHDGTDRVSKAVSQLVGPGKVFVIAAGNNANKYQYSWGMATVNNSMNMLLGCYNLHYGHGYYYDHVELDSWVRKKNTRPISQFLILDLKTKRIVWRSDFINLHTRINASQISEYYEVNRSVDTLGYVEGLVTLNPSNTKFMVKSTIHNLRSKSYTTDADGYITSRYQIGIAVYPPYVMNPRLADTCMVDSWMYTGNGQRLTYNDVVYIDEVNDQGDTTTRGVYNYFCSPSDFASIGSYAVNDSIISAGAYVARNQFYSINEDTTYWNSTNPIGSFYRNSSYEAAGYGPTGQALPTVMAPGFDVVSAVSRYNYYAVHGAITVMRYQGNYWAVITGTSMAAPTVAGIIADWLQINPNLSPGDIKKVIAATAIKDEFTESPIEYRRYGPNGKIDALAGARYILDHSSFIYGDVNGDGLINVEDLTIMIDHKLGRVRPGTIVAALDVNRDGNFDISDISSLISCLLSGTY